MGYFDSLPWGTDKRCRPGKDCGDEAACRIRRIMGKVRDATIGILDNTSLRDTLIPGSHDMTPHYAI